MERHGLLVPYEFANTSPGERDDVYPSDGLSQASDEGPRPTRPRAEPSNVPGGSSRRPPQDSRRKRANEQRYAGWGDEIERVYCARAQQGLPRTFPVASHSGAATIT